MMATQGSFPQQFSEAIQEFPNFTSAYAQLSNGVDYIDLQIQVPEMLVQFCGNVHFGSVVKGTLFYKSSLNIRAVYFTVFYYKEPGTLKTVRVDFYALTRDEMKPFAKFLAKVDATILPPLRPGLGKGKWQKSAVASCAATFHRQSQTTFVVLIIPPIRKQAEFTTLVEGSILTSGFLILDNLKKMENPPPCVVRYQPDIIVFHNKEDENDILATFFPTEPIKNVGEEPEEKPIVSWKASSGPDFTYTYS